MLRDHRGSVQIAGACKKQIETLNRAQTVLMLIALGVRFARDYASDLIGAKLEVLPLVLFGALFMPYVARKGEKKSSVPIFTAYAVGCAFAGCAVIATALGAGVQKMSESPNRDPVAVFGVVLYTSLAFVLLASAYTGRKLVGCWCVFCFLMWGFAA